MWEETGGNQMSFSRLLTSAEVISVLEAIKNQYPIGENIVSAFQSIADQAMLVNLLIEENALLKLQNEKLKLSQN